MSRNEITHRSPPLAKKLSEIRQQIEKALAPTAADPIQRLERQVASAKRKGDRTEVLGGLKRFLESPRKGKHRKRSAGAKSGVAAGMRATGNRVVPFACGLRLRFPIPLRQTR